MPKKMDHAFLTSITKKNQPTNIWVVKGTEIVGELKKLCKAERIQVYTTMSETKVAFVERTKRSLKKIYTVTWKLMHRSIFTN